MTLAFLSTRPLPDPSAFEDQRLKRKRPLYTPSHCPNTSLRCPSSPSRSPFIHSDKQCKTELKKSRTSSSNFDFLLKLGEGSFGEVFKAVHLTDQKYYAIKKSKKPIWNTNQRTQYMSEVVNTQHLGYHKNVVQLFGTWEEGGHIYIQAELCEKSLKDICTAEGAIPESTIWKYLADMTQGLAHIHSHHIIHLDLKPENILLGTDGMLKLGDLGNAARMGSGQEFVEGDKVYMAPELLDDVFSPAADIFSLGITLFEMATGLELPGSGQWWSRLREGEDALYPLLNHEVDNIISLSAPTTPAPSSCSFSRSSSFSSSSSSSPTVAPPVPSTPVDSITINSSATTTPTTPVTPATASTPSPPFPPSSCMSISPPSTYSTNPLSDELKMLIMDMMNPNPKQRPTVQAVLEHPLVAVHHCTNVEPPTKKYKVSRQLFHL